MSDAVEILLSVDDQASEAVSKAANKVNSVERDVAKAKPSVMGLEKAGRTAGDAIGRIGDSLDVPELGRAAGAIGGIAEQLQNAKEASEGMKLGVVGTAGVVGGVAASAFAIGRAFGDVVFQTTAWEEKLKSGLDVMQQLESRRGRMAQQSFQDRLSRLDATSAPDTAYVELIRDLKREAEGVSRNLAAEVTRLDGMTSAYYTFVDTFSKQLAEANIRSFQTQLEQLKEQENQVERILTVERELTKERERKSRAESEAKFIKQLQDELELLTASADEQDRIIAARNAASIEGQAAIEMLLQAKRSAQQEVEKAIIKSDQVKQVTAKPRAMQERPNQLDAFESRLLTRGPSQPSSEETKTLKQILQELKDQKKLQEKTTQDLSMLIRNPLVIGAPGGRR